MAVVNEDLVKQIAKLQEELDMWKQTIEEIDAIKKGISELKMVLLNEMQEQKVKEVMVGNIKVEDKSFVTNRFDTSAFKAEEGELFEKYSKESVTRKIEVRVIENGQ